MIPYLHQIGQMRSSLLRSFGCGLALLLASAGNWSLAQDTKRPAAAPEKPKESSPRSGQLWELDIAEGNLWRHDGTTVPATLGRVVGYLRDKYPANVVLAPGVGELQVGDVKLASFKWETALEALRVASGDAFVWTRQGAGQAPSVVDPTTGLPVQSDEDLFVLTPNQEGPLSRSKRVVEVFNMSGYVRGQNPEKVDDNLGRIINAVRETLQDLHEGIPTASAGPRFKYHDGSSLLIVIGSPEEVEVARKIVLALPDTSTSKEPGVPSGANDAFRRRYGLSPMPTPPPANNVPAAPAPGAPGGTKR